MHIHDKNPDIDDSIKSIRFQIEGDSNEYELNFGIM